MEMDMSMEMNQVQIQIISSERKISKSYLG